MKEEPTVLAFGDIPIRPSFTMKTTKPSSIATKQPFCPKHLEPKTTQASSSSLQRPAQQIFANRPRPSLHAEASDRCRRPQGRVSRDPVISTRYPGATRREYREAPCLEILLDPATLSHPARRTSQTRYPGKSE